MHSPDIGHCDRPPDEPGVACRPEPVDRQAQLRLLVEQIAAVERVLVAPGDGPGDADRPAGQRRTSAKGSARQGSDGQAAEKRTPAQQVAVARAICLRLLTVAPRPRAGLAQALKRKEIPDDVAESVLDRLAQVGLIDDVAYAHSFVRTKHRDRALGRTALRTELRRLGVDEESMADAVQTIDPEAERARAEELIAKRLDAAMAAGSVAARRRLLGLLGRRGYPPDIAISVVEGAIAGYVQGPDDRF
jgi:regulatory protein